MFHLNEDNKVTAVLARITELVYLQLLFLLTSIPVITIGAGLSALFSVSRKLHLDTISEIAPNYFKAFAANFKRSTLAWLFFLFIALMVYVDVNFYAERGTFGLAARILVYVIAGLAYLCFVYIFPMLAWLDRKLLPQMKNALILAFAHAGATVIVTLIYAAAFALSKLLFPLFLFIGFSGPIYLATTVMLKPLSTHAPELLPTFENPEKDAEQAADKPSETKPD